jgi:hypothetical protein
MDIKVCLGGGEHRRHAFILTVIDTFHPGIGGRRKTAYSIKQNAIKQLMGRNH